MEKTRWHLNIQTKEFNNGTHMEADSGPEIVRVAFELSFLDHYGKELVKKSREDSIQRNRYKGLLEFVEEDDVYTNRRSEYLLARTLTAGSRMRGIGVPIHISAFCSITSVVGVELHSIEWNIENFNEIQPGMIITMGKSTNPSAAFFDF
ncbi:hypothetical protein AVEN_1713-1 [Araneus ventricosus]|uniref:Uncharacterized protein n=1 Tax=Araneus ventricosus TaxID=182803 RepID=A0A4Y2WGB5_ARAVE|nr:hypothetical protein AVEN_1713-1 [Araneus ventricosus]